MKIAHILEPEKAHNLAIFTGKVVKKFPSLLNRLKKKYELNTPELEVKIGNLTFPNPIGLAAGFDKDGEII